MGKGFETVAVAAVNTAYSHSSLSARCLTKALGGKALMREFTINDTVARAAAELYETHAELYAFSCYIWNIEFVSKVCRILKQASPQTKILLGGPEVSYDAPAFMEENEFADYIICGEGEISVCELANGTDEAEIGGLVYRKDGKTVQNPIKIIEKLAELPRIYDEDELAEFANKILYYETSRGCPYKCSYCLSSTSHGVRFFPLERVLEDFLLFMRAGVRLVKLVDRTFNTDKRRTMEIIRFIIANNTETCFHFEVTADIMDDELVELLCSAPKGYFQLEIGVQSTNTKTLTAINRSTRLDRLYRNVKRLTDARNMHIHLDLIAGLPYENYDSFARSFDDVFALKPDMLQLGFLKLLKGTRLRGEEKSYSYRYNPSPTYEVISNEFISYDEILSLKGVENITDRYYNSAAFEKSLECALRQYDSAFEFFKEFSLFFAENGYDKRPQSKKTLYDIFARFYRAKELGDEALFLDCLKFDFIKSNQNMTLPEWAARVCDKRFYSEAYELLASDRGERYAEGCKGAKTSELMRRFRVEKFNFDVLQDGKIGECVILFDYGKNSFAKIEEKF